MTINNTQVLIRLQGYDMTDMIWFLNTGVQIPNVFWLRTSLGETKKATNEIRTEEIFRTRHQACI